MEYANYPEKRKILGPDTLEKQSYGLSLAINQKPEGEIYVSRSNERLVSGIVWMFHSEYLL